MIILAMDTSDTNGSVDVQRDGKLLSFRLHSAGEDYSSWLLPAVFAALAEAGTSLERVDVLAVCTGPGSFTGLRVGLTTVKAWAEIYGTKIVAVPRLEALARNGITRVESATRVASLSESQTFRDDTTNIGSATRVADLSEPQGSPVNQTSAGSAAEVSPGREPWVKVENKSSAGGAADSVPPDPQSTAAKPAFVLACYDAQRGQSFAAFYRREEGVLTPVGAEMVATPQEILQIVAQHADTALVEWVQLGGDPISTAPGWQARAVLGDVLTASSLNLAATIAEIARERAAKNQFTGVLQLDANYVRRSDAEIFWKGPAKRVP